MICWRAKGRDSSPMTKAEALRALSARELELRALGVGRLHVFGSTACDLARPDSDLDLLVDPAPGRKSSLFDLVGVKLLVEDQLRIEADVTTRSGLHPLLRDRIEREAVRVF